ncbi:MAG: hypothetical protein HRT88_12170 [Lentisphaeraceae bacterium]|nr:hypothetical protein [Lentisphaeraceae bacterium]
MDIEEENTKYAEEERLPSFNWVLSAEDYDNFVRELHEAEKTYADLPRESLEGGVNLFSEPIPTFKGWDSL